MREGGWADLWQALTATLLIFSATLSACVSNQADRPLQDEARAWNVVSTVLDLADTQCFTELEQLHARSVITDYTSLWGGEPRGLSNHQVAAAWAGFLPGFDATLHRLTNETMETTDGGIHVRADVEAMHWLEGEYWWLAGVYDVDLIQAPDGHWVITHWVFTLTDERGDRRLVDEAERRAGRTPHNCVIRRETLDKADRID
ncbi:MAG: nuclear transport factor 2 family protein [Pseudomonadota bacterium]